MGKKKYIKNSKGVTMSVTTDTLGLEKPLLNENYDIDVHNRNMDKIDEDLKPIDDSYIIELFQHDGDTTNPRDYYTKVEADEKFATKEEVENIDLSNLATKEEVNNALNKANEALQIGSNVKQSLVDKLTSEGLNVSTNNTFEELIGGIALGKKSASGTLKSSSSALSFSTLNGTDTASYVIINKSSIGFTPSIILITFEPSPSSSDFSYFSVYTNYSSLYAGGVVRAGNFYNKGVQQVHACTFKVDSKIITSESYVIPCMYGNGDYNWIAFE